MIYRKIHNLKESCCYIGSQCISDKSIAERYSSQFCRVVSHLAVCVSYLKVSARKVTSQCLIVRDLVSYALPCSQQGLMLVSFVDSTQYTSWVRNAYIHTSPSLSFPKVHRKTEKKNFHVIDMSALIQAIRVAVTRSIISQEIRNVTFVNTFVPSDELFKDC